MKADKLVGSCNTPVSLVFAFKVYISLKRGLGFTRQK